VDKAIQFKLTFLDGSDVIWTSNSSVLQYAIADLISKKFYNIDDIHYNANHLFSWEVVK